MFPVLLGVSFIIFSFVQFVPGGPIDQTLAKLKGSNSHLSHIESKTITEEELQIIEAYYGFDKPFLIRYFSWLAKVLCFDFGESYSYGEPVWEIVKSKFPISLFFGLVSFLLSYLICIPLGVLKALKHGSWFDSISSFIVFLGYVIPSYALGIVLIILFSSQQYLDWFPLSGFVSESYSELNFFEKIIDIVWHMFLPMICYMVGEFAFLTFLVKNSVLEEIKSEYVRFSILKGSSFYWAVWRHALKNALLPIATRLGEVTTIMFTGALLIEKVFDIDGMGLLTYNAMIDRDYNMVMAVILCTSFLVLLGRLISDILFVYIDPRIRLQ